MVSSVSPETEHTPAKVLTVSRESTPATAVRPDNESTRHHVQHRTRRRRGRRQRDRRTWLRRPWAAAGPGQTLRRHTEQAPPAWKAPEGPEDLAAAPVGGGGAWPDVETTHRAGAAGVKGAGGTGGPGRGAGGRRQGQGGPRDRPLRAVRLACGDLVGGPPPTSTHSGQAHRQTIRRPEHQRRQSTTATGTATPRQA